MPPRDRDDGWPELPEDVRQLEPGRAQDADSEALAVPVCCDGAELLREELGEATTRDDGGGSRDLLAYGLDHAVGISVKRFCTDNGCCGRGAVAVWRCGGVDRR